MMRHKKIFFATLALTLFFTFINTSVIEAARTIPDDLYVGTLKSNETQALDISNNPDPAERDYILTFGVHGLGNQLLNFEYRAREDGYIISAANSNERLFNSTLAKESARAIRLDTPVNNLTEFEDSFIWDVTATTGGFYNISNRLTKKYITFGSINNRIKMAAKNNLATQQFRLTTMNGLYLIKSNPSPTRGFDIEGGTAAGKSIIAYDYLGKPGKNQQWFVLYRPEENGYFITNASNKSIYIAQDSLTAEPKSRLYEQPYSKIMPLSQLFSFTTQSFTANGEPIVTITNQAYPGHNLVASGTSGYLNRISLKPSTGTSGYKKWIFHKYGTIEKPLIDSLTISSTLEEEKDFYYAGEKLTVSGNFSASANSYKMFDLYTRFGKEKPKLQEEKIPIITNNTRTKFSVKIDTTEFKEGNHFVEFFTRADSMFISNKLATEYKIKYPTPTGKATAIQNISYRIDVKDIDTTKLVTDLADEIGSEIEVVGFENPETIDTTKLGKQDVIVLIKNAYKTEKISTKINIVDVEYPKPTFEGLKELENSMVSLKVEQEVPYSVATGVDLKVNLSEYVEKIESKDIKVTITDDASKIYETENNESTIKIYQQIIDSPTGTNQIINYKLSKEMIDNMLFENQSKTKLTFSISVPLSKVNKLKKTIAKHEEVPVFEIPLQLSSNHYTEEFFNSKSLVKIQVPKGETKPFAVEKGSMAVDYDPNLYVTQAESMIDGDTFEIRFKENYEFSDIQPMDGEIIIKSNLTGLETSLVVKITVVEDAATFITLKNSIELKAEGKLIQAYSDITYTGKSVSGIKVITEPLVKIKNKKDNKEIDLMVYKSNNKRLKSDELLTTLNKTNPCYRFALKSPKSAFKENGKYTGEMIISFELD